jgi:hypothetical protein
MKSGLAIFFTRHELNAEFRENRHSESRTLVGKREGKGKVQPITGHEGKNGK